MEPATAQIDKRKYIITKRIFHQL